MSLRGCHDERGGSSEQGLCERAPRARLHDVRERANDDAQAAKAGGERDEPDRGGDGLGSALSRLSLAGVCLGIFVSPDQAAAS